MREYAYIFRQMSTQIHISEKIQSVRKIIIPVATCYRRRSVTFFRRDRSTVTNGSADIANNIPVESNPAAGILKNPVTDAIADDHPVVFSDNYFSLITTIRIPA